MIVAEMPASMADYEVGDDLEFKPVTPLQVVGFLYWLLILPVFQYAASYIFLKAARNQNFEVKEVLDGFSKYPKIVLANLLTMLLVFLGLVLLIIPGIIVICRIAFVPYIVMDQGLGPVAAVEKSWKMTKGHGWTIFGMGLLAIPIIIVGLLLLLVGAIFAAMLVFCSFAGLYYAVTQAHPNESNPETMETPV
jgi:uncharacterized membrane protein